MHNDEEILPSYSIQGARFQANRDDDVIYLTVTGRLVISNHDGTLITWLLQFHEKVMELGLELVVVDVQPLEFTNSSGIAAFIRWIGALNQTSEDTRYHVRIVCDGDSGWQFSTFSHLQLLLSSHVKVEKDDADQHL